MRITKNKLIEKLKQGEVAIIPTDTIYGIVGVAKKTRTVNKIYHLKSRDSKKPFIILIKSIQDLKFFGIKLSEAEKKILKKIWPGKISIILPCPYKKFNYLHRGTEKLAFRLPKKKSLLEIIKNTGPLVAPSANPKNLKPATTIKEAKNYFGDKIETYLNQGKLESKPSTLIEIKNKKIKILRTGELREKNFVL